MGRILKLFGYEKINNIKIQEEFKNHPPRPLKMLVKKIYHINHGRFEQPIVLNEKGYLIDGYTTYLIAKGMGKKYIKVVRIKEDEQIG